MGNDNTFSKRTDRIKSWLGSGSGKYDIFFVLLLYIAAVAVYSLIDNYSKRIDIYSDELLYYTIAQSIHDGKGIMAMNAHVAFNKFVYPLVLSPFFGIEDPVLRVSMISLFNKALMLTSIFFIYLIGKELELKRGSILLTLAITVLWPDLTYSMTFMSENLNWPLSLLAIFLWFKGKKSKHTVVYALAFGAVCYIGYLCKNIFLALLLSAVLFEAAYPIVTYWASRRDDPDKRLREYFDKRGLLGCGISIALFAVCYVLGSVLLFGGSDANISSSLTVKSDQYTTNYTILYLLFAFAYYLAASLIAVLAMPVAYSAASFKRMDTSTRRIFSMLSIYLVISCAMIAFTISIKEDIGSVLPRLHMRYLGFILLLLVVVFFKVLQTKSDIDPISSRGKLIFTMAAAFLACMLFQGSDNAKALTDQSTLNIYNLASIVLLGYTDTFLGKRFYVIKFASFAVIAIIILITYYFRNKRKAERSAALVFSLFMMFICFRNFGIECGEIEYAYKAENEIVDNVLTINRYLDKAGSDKQILFVCSSNLSKEQKILTTYFDHLSQLCQCPDEGIADYAADGKTVDVPNSEFEFSVAASTYTYDRFDGFDYIILENRCQTELRGVTPIDEASGDFYTLYENIDPATVEIKPVVYAGEPLTITFAEDNNNMETYCRYGLDTGDENYSWTNDDRASFKIPVLGEYESVKVSIEVAETLNNTKQRYIIVQNDDILSEGALTGAGEISFTAPVKDGNLEFNLVCPTALLLNNEDFELAITGQLKRYAFKVSSIVVE